MTPSMNIGQAAQAAGVSTKMIRHYEQIGLLPEAARSEAGYRRYGERDICVLRFIRHSRQLGFSIEQIARLLGLWSDGGRASREVRQITRQHVAALEQRMRELGTMKAALEGLLARCHGDDEPHCPILDDLAAGCPLAPEPGSVGSCALHRPAPRRHSARTATEANGLVSTGHLELMAWARQLQRPQL